ncbi:MAG TPA: hypothetical protein VED66_04630, partial [Candidatus Sulfotelmatobacter sp.]|nr:hypothetical protein [Candidatus Sulfotelmatobacter sp.]
MSRSFSEGDRESSEKLCILLSSWRGLLQRAHNRAGAAIKIASLLLNYAENERRKRRRVFSDQIFKPEGPHSTTDGLSAL